MGNVQTFLPYLRQAKLGGLRLTFHVAEVSNRDLIVNTSNVHSAVLSVDQCVHTESIIIYSCMYLQKVTVRW